MKTVSFTLENKVAIITAAGAGIGRAIAEAYVQAGAKVVLTGRSDSVHRLAERFPSDRVQSLIWDVCDYAGIPALVESVLKRWGRIDILVNNAGIAILESAENVSEEAWDRTMNANLKSAFMLSQAVGRKFLEQRHGKIINIASQAALVALPEHLAYCTSKAALVALTKGLALEWGPNNIQVNAISPTVVLTEMGRVAWSGEVGEAMKQKIPLRRFAKPEEIAAAAVYLASPAADMITGENLVIDGGYTIT